MPRMYLKGSVRERFEPRVDRSGGPDACHPWLGARNEHGYGVMTFANLKPRMQKAHRIAWTLAHGEPPPDKPNVLHDCHGGDNPACCNVRHLFCGTQADNIRDCVAKGRQSRGSARPAAALDEAAVVAIRRSDLRVA